MTQGGKGFELFLHHPPLSSNLSTNFFKKKIFFFMRGEGAKQPLHLDDRIVARRHDFTSSRLDYV